MSDIRFVSFFPTGFIIFIFSLNLLCPMQGFDPQALLDDVRKLKLIVKAHERRIKSLEDKVAQYEANTSDEEEEADHC